LIGRSSHEHTPFLLRAAAARTAFDLGRETPIVHAILGVDALRNAPDRGVTWLDRLLNDVRARVGETLEDDWTALLLERVAV